MGSSWVVWEVVMLNVHSTSKAELLNFQTVKNAYFCISFRMLGKFTYCEKPPTES